MNRKIIIDYFIKQIPEDEQINITVSIPNMQPNTFQLNLDSNNVKKTGATQSQTFLNFMYDSLMEGFQNNTNTDVAIVTSDKKEVPAHKLVLAAFSDLFRVVIADNPNETKFEIPYPYDQVDSIIKSFYNEYDFLQVPSTQQMLNIQICLFLGISDYIQEIKDKYDKIQLNEYNIDDYLHYLYHFQDKEVWFKSLNNIIAFLLTKVDNWIAMQSILLPTVIDHFDNAVILDALLTLAKFPEKEIISSVHKIPLTIREILHVFDKPHFSQHPSVVSFLDLLLNTGKEIYEAATTLPIGQDKNLFSINNYYILPCTFINRIQPHPDEPSTGDFWPTSLELGRPITSIDDLKQLLFDRSFRIVGNTIEYTNPISDFAILKHVNVSIGSRYSHAVFGVGCFGILHKDSPWRIDTKENNPKVFIASIFYLEQQFGKYQDLFATYLSRDRPLLASQCDFTKHLVTEKEVLAGLNRIVAPDEYPIWREIAVPIPEAPNRSKHELVTIVNNLPVREKYNLSTKLYGLPDLTLVPCWATTSATIFLNQEIMDTFFMKHLKSGLKLSAAQPTSTLLTINTGHVSPTPPIITPTLTIPQSTAMVFPTGVSIPLTTQPSIPILVTPQVVPPIIPRSSLATPIVPPIPK